MKAIQFLFIAILFGSHLVVAQNNPIQIIGKVVESAGGQPLEYATVKISDAQTDELITGTITDMDGNFFLETKSTGISVEVGFIGFKPTLITQIDIVSEEINLGTITLVADAETLGEVVVRGERSQTVFQLDKRVFNVGQDLSSTGASALEVLNNVPSVTVNIEGQIQLRGSSAVQILVDGKPSVIASQQGNALGTITADMIDRIEVITNPSAKYDAEGTSGIINIVLKKEEKRGLNGSVSLNTGVPNNHSLGFSINNRTEKFNLFSQLGMGHRTFPVQYNTINRDIESNTNVTGSGESEKDESYFNLILGTDYHINPRNILSLTGSFEYELEEEISDTEYLMSSTPNTSSTLWNRNELTEGKNPKWEFELQYLKGFSDHKDHMLLFSALGSYFGKTQWSDFDDQAADGSLIGQQKTFTDFLQDEYILKLDYTKPFSKYFTLETGAQYLITNVTSDYSVSNWADNAFVEDPALTNVFDYSQKVLGLYSTAAYEGDLFGVKLGLRMENTDLNTLLLNTNESNRQNYTNLFPTFHSSYKLMENFSLQAGYSRRISRPGLWDLNPFTIIRNNFNIRSGNPFLKPEHTDSYEVTGIYDHRLFSFIAAVYYRYTTDVVENFSSFQNNISITRPENVGINRATGVELVGKYNPFEWWALSSEFNYNYYRREGVMETATFNFDADQWTARMTTRFKLPLDIDFEVTGNYRSGYQTFQQEISENMFVDMGLRKRLMNGRTIINLSVRDVFASRNFESEISQPSFYIYDYRQQGRFISLGVSYGFGKGEAMEFSSQKRF
jgi:outer membrane receptor protein involved in Fe transport